MSQQTGDTGAEPRHRPVTVLVVDDQEPFRDAMREVVAATPGFTLVGEATSGEGGMIGVAELSPELVLMDVRMPGLGGIAAARELAGAHPDLVLILVSVDGVDGLPGDASSCGATACVRKQDLRPRTLRELWGTHGSS
jgi:DNA-binding NarL/FixJ family response regulator